MIERIDRMAPRWRELREAYPRIATGMALGIALLLLADLVLAYKREHLVIMSPLRKAVGILTTFDIVQHMAGLHAGTYRSSMGIAD